MGDAIYSANISSSLLKHHQSLLATYSWFLIRHTAVITQADFGRWWGTGRPGMLQSMGLQRVGHDWVTKEVITCNKVLACCLPPRPKEGEILLVVTWWLRQYSIGLQCGRPRFNPWVRKLSWRRKWQPTAVFLPGKSHGWRNLVGYSPWGRKELDMTERLHFTALATFTPISITLSLFLSSKHFSSIGELGSTGGDIVCKPSTFQENWVFIRLSPTHTQK